MQFRKANPTDAESIMNIFRQAQTRLHSQGVDQWQNGYPNSDIVDKDISSGDSRVFVQNEQIAAVFVLSFGHEDTYDHIFYGQWLSTGQYGVIHRMAVADSFLRQGLGEALILEAEHVCLAHGIHSIKVDTHRDNKTMQSLLAKNEFQLCGTIYLDDGDKRLAFEKMF